MANPNDLWSWIMTDQAKTVLAGAAGGIVRWVTLREHWRDGILSLLVGAICAVYLGSLVAPILEPVIGRLAPGGDTAGFSAFVVGIGGMSISGMLIDIFRARRAEIRERAKNKGDSSNGGGDAQP